MGQGKAVICWKAVAEDRNRAVKTVEGSCDRSSSTLAMRLHPRLTQPATSATTKPRQAPPHLIWFSHAMMSASEGRLGSFAELSSTASPTAAAAGAPPLTPAAGAAATTCCCCCCSCLRRASSRDACIARAMLLSQSSGSCRHQWEGQMWVRASWPQWGGPQWR